MLVRLLAAALGAAILAGPAVADDDDYRAERDRSTIGARGPYYGYFDRGDWTTPEHAWWRDYERQSALQRGEDPSTIRRPQIYEYRTRSYSFHPYYMPDYGYVESEDFESREPERLRSFEQERRLDRFEADRTRTWRLRGQIQDLRVLRSERWDRPQVIAYLDTDEPALARVLLGPVEEVRALDIRRGDTISVVGTSDIINGEPALLATRWFSSDTRGTGLPAAQTMQWYNGEVLSLHTLPLEGISQAVVRVRLDDGSTSLTHLGPADALRNVDIAPGDDIQVLARVDRVGNETGLVAQRFRVNAERTITVPGQGGISLQMETDVE